LPRQEPSWRQFCSLPRRRQPVPRCRLRRPGCHGHRLARRHRRRASAHQFRHQRGRGDAADKIRLSAHTSAWIPS